MNTKVFTLQEPRVTLCGSAALLFEAEGRLELPTQERIWKLSREVRDWPAVLDAQPGMNNLLVVFDTIVADPEALSERLLSRWSCTSAEASEGRLLELGVIYGGERGSDLPHLAAHHGLTIDEVVRLHSDPDYIVFAPSVTPGFGYLYGLNERLFTPRKRLPVMRPVGGRVSIGGGQSNVGNPPLIGGPTVSPTGWHVIGFAPEAPPPFDLGRTPPNLLALGDRIRFRVERVER